MIGIKQLKTEIRLSAKKVVNEIIQSASSAVIRYVLIVEGI